jgi:hypothetical protein
MGGGLAAVVFESLRAESGIFEHESAANAEGDFFGLPGGHCSNESGSDSDGFCGWLNQFTVN